VDLSLRGHRPRKLGAARSPQSFRTARAHLRRSRSTAIGPSMPNVLSIGSGQVMAGRAAQGRWRGPARPGVGYTRSRPGSGSASSRAAAALHASLTPISPPIARTSAPTIGPGLSWWRPSFRAQRSAVLARHFLPPGRRSWYRRWRAISRVGGGELVWRERVAGAAINEALARVAPIAGIEPPTWFQGTRSQMG
jgi:hypothetical protein